MKRGLRLESKYQEFARALRQEISVLEPEVLSEKEVFQEEGVKDKDKILQAGSGKAGPLSIGLEKGVAEG